MAKKMQKGQADIAKLKERLLECSHLSATLNLMNWDQEVFMPKKGSDARAAAVAYLSGVAHATYLAIDKDGLLSRLKKDLDRGKVRGETAVIVKEVWRNLKREKKLPEEFVKELAETVSKAQTLWAEARAKDDFKLFLPWLKKIVALKQKEAKYVGYSESPYDALLDAYEPDMTASEASKILNDLKDFLIPFLKKIKASPVSIKRSRVFGTFPIEKQKKFNSFIAKTMGFDEEAGRIDESTHPFTTNFHPFDVRFTTRYRESDILYSISSTVHEAGHALYEQGLPSEHFGTPLGESISLGVHESQSRLWENNLGKSTPFWKYFYPRLQREFPKPFKNISLADFLSIVNEVKPSLIRTEADEVTYNLHIIIRFEIEKEMIEGSIAIEDLPKIWKSKMKEYLGIDVPSDREGVLQDVHWSAGYIGYFPTYSFGNLYAAQFYAAMKKDLRNGGKEIASGNLKNVREWLRRNIHEKGKRLSAAELVKKVTGEELNSRYFEEYVDEKYSKLYALKK